MKRPVHVVVVAFHGADSLDRCLSSVGTGYARTVIDNSSSSDVRAVALRHALEYVDPGENRGFAAGVNAALRRILEDGRAVDVLLLNPDAEVTSESVGRLVVQLHRQGAERCGGVAPTVTDPDGIVQQTLWPFPSPARAWLEAVGFARRSSSTQFAIGAVLLLRWEALKEVGLFDERFFLYAEEADWQRRALELGWRTEQCAGAVAVHTGAGTSDDPLRREVLFHAAHETYIRKWHGTAGWWVYRAAAVAGASARALVLRRERRREAARRVALYAYGPRRRAGFTPPQT